MAKGRIRHQEDVGVPILIAWRHVGGKKMVVIVLVRNILTVMEPVLWVARKVPSRDCVRAVVPVAQLSVIWESEAFVYAAMSNLLPGILLPSAVMATKDLAGHRAIAS
jgi:hypothetical protein